MPFKTSHPVIECPEKYLSSFGSYEVPDKCKGCPVAQIAIGIATEHTYIEREDSLNGRTSSQKTLTTTPEQQRKLEELIAECSGKIGGWRGFLKTILNQAKEAVTYGGPVQDMDSRVIYDEPIFNQAEGCPTNPRQIDKILGKHTAKPFQDYDRGRVIGFSLTHEGRGFTVGDKPTTP